MPKVNRRELFDTPVPMSSNQEEREGVAEMLLSTRSLVVQVEREISALREVRSALLVMLVGDRHSIPESYDSLLPEVA